MYLSCSGSSAASSRTPSIGSDLSCYEAVCSSPFSGRKVARQLSSPLAKYHYSAEPEQQCTLSFHQHCCLIKSALLACEPRAVTRWTLMHLLELIEQCPEPPSETSFHPSDYVGNLIELAVSPHYGYYDLLPAFAKVHFRENGSLRVLDLTSDEIYKPLYSKRESAEVWLNKMINYSWGMIPFKTLTAFSLDLSNPGGAFEAQHEFIKTKFQECAAVLLKILKYNPPFLKQERRELLLLCLRYARVKNCSVFIKSTLENSVVAYQFRNDQEWFSQLT